MKKFMLKVMPIILVALFVVATPVFAVTEPTGGTQITSITGFANNAWATAKAVIQVLAIIAVLVAGARYMFASADTKADIKQQTIILVVGAILVFSAVPIINFVTNIANNVFK